MAFHVYTGTTAPSTAPTAVGDHYIDTVAGVSYISTGTSSSADWKSAGTTDTNAIHKTTAGEISALTAKAVPTGSDYLLIEDAAAGDAKKRITIADLPSSGAGATAQLSWKFETSTTMSAPTNKYFRLNNGTPASVTQFAVDDNAFSGLDASNIFGILAAGNKIYIQQQDDATKYILMSIVSIADQTGWWLATVTIDDSGTIFGNNKECTWFIFGAAGTSYTDEQAQDAVGAMVANSSKVSLTYVDAAPSLTADIIAGSLVNADISNSAAIAYSKLNLSASIVNADVSNSAAIIYSKLNLTGAIVNADINGSAAIAVNKLAALSVSLPVVTDGSGFISTTSYASLASSLNSSISASAIGVGSFTQGSVIFAGATNLAQDNATFYWDTTNKRLGLGVGAASNTVTVNGITFGSVLTVGGDGVTDVMLSSLHRHSSNGALGASFNFVKSRGSSGAETAVSNNELIGTIWANGHDGTDYANSSSISFEVDGTVASNQMPGRIIFKTSPSGSQTLTEALRIDSAQLSTFVKVQTPQIVFSGNASSAAWTTNGIKIRTAAATFTDTTSSGTVATAYTDSLGDSTIAASSSTTYTNYISTFIKDPIAGTNVTFTNKYALGAESARFGTSNQVTISNAGVITATSPVFTTPNLGTPSTLVGTNITGTASGLTAGTCTTIPNLTGHITSTGNATVLGSFTGAQLYAALSANKTGTSSIVFSDGASVTNPTVDRISFTGNLSSAAWGMVGLKLTGSGATLTDTSTAASGTVAAATTAVLSQGTIAATNTGVTYTHYYGAWAYAPTAGTNVTITNPWAIGAESMRIGNSNQFSINSAGLATFGVNPVGLITTSVDNTIPRFDGTTGKLQSSSITITDTNDFSNVIRLYMNETNAAYTASGPDGYVHSSGTLTATAAGCVAPALVRSDKAYTNSGSGTYSFLGSGFLFWNKSAFSDTTGATNSGSLYTLIAQPTWTTNTAGFTQLLATDISVAPSWSVTGSGTIVSSINNNYSTSASIGTGVTLTARQGYSFADTTGSGTATYTVGFVTNALSKATNSAHIQLGSASNLTGNYAINSQTTYACLWSGAHLWKQRSTSTNATTTLSTDHVIFVTGTVSAMTFLLATTAGKQELIIRNDSSNTVTMTTSGSDTTTGTMTIAAGTSKTFLCDGVSKWYHVSTG